MYHVPQEWFGSSCLYLFIFSIFQWYEIICTTNLGVKFQEAMSESRSGRLGSFVARLTHHALNELNLL